MYRRFSLTLARQSQQERHNTTFLSLSLRNREEIFLTLLSPTIFSLLLSPYKGKKRKRRSVQKSKRALGTLRTDRSSVRAESLVKKEIAREQAAKMRVSTAK